MSSDVVIQVENLSKQYRLGEVSTGSLGHDINRWWHRIRGKEDPYLSITGENIRTRKREVAIKAEKLKSENTKNSAFQRFSISAFSSDYVWALRDINFEVKRGEVLGIIGRNGAGKSTLLKILSRITAPTTGEVRVKGRIASLLEVGTGFHQDLTGRENIYLNGAIMGMTKPEITSKLDEIVEFSGCAAYLDTPVKRYSSGMRVRLGFAVAAHLEPEILIVDEVLAVGDAEFQKKCIGKMQDVASHGWTVLFVSHNMAAVSQLCDRVIVLEAGHVSYASDCLSGVQQYLASVENARPRCAWDRSGEAPGDDYVRIVGVQVLQAGELAPSVDINRSVDVEIEFDVLKAVERVVNGVHFFNAEGLCLFAHCDWRAVPMMPGRYRKRATVPPHRFAEGRVNVLVQVVYNAPFIRQVVLPNAVSFESHESDHPDSVRGSHKGSWPGVVRVPLTWSAAEQLREGLNE